MYVLKTSPTFDFEKVGIKGKIFPVKNLSSQSGIIYVETESGHATTIINHVCDVYYYVIEGSGYFEINHQKEDYRQGDLVVIPHNLPFTYKGKGKFLRITTPPFTPDQEETMPD